MPQMEARIFDEPLLQVASHSFPRFKPSSIAANQSRSTSTGNSTRGRLPVNRPITICGTA